MFLVCQQFVITSTRKINTIYRKVRGIIRLIGHRTCRAAVIKCQSLTLTSSVEGLVLESGYEFLGLSLKSEAHFSDLETFFESG